MTYNQVLDRVEKVEDSEYDEEDEYYDEEDDAEKSG